MLLKQPGPGVSLNPKEHFILLERLISYLNLSWAAVSTLRASISFICCASLCLFYILIASILFRSCWDGLFLNFIISMLLEYLICLILIFQAAGFVHIGSNSWSSSFICLVFSRFEKFDIHSAVFFCIETLNFFKGLAKLVWVLSLVYYSCKPVPVLVIELILGFLEYLFGW